MSLILIVDDEVNIVTTLRQVLQREGYEVITAANAKEADLAVRSTPPDLVLLDWMLPDESGPELLRRWRASSARLRALPVLFVTARVDVVDRIVGLELGADDYITKPFDPRELIARVRARLRTRAEPADTLSHLGVHIELATRTVRFDGIEISLTKLEFDLLCLLIEHPGRVFGREELLGRVWGYERMPTTRTVDTHVHVLRSKLDASLFESVRGVGYRMKRERS